MKAMSSMERVLTTLGHREPDRVPLFLLLTMHGAKELGLGIKEYFGNVEHVVEGQLRMLKKYRHDCLYPFFYAPIEVEAWGGEVIYADDGPPNSGAPVITSAEKVASLSPPDVYRTPCLLKVLDVISGLKANVGGTVPIIGVVMSPFSLPVMQMGFGAYFELMHEQPDFFWKLMRVNEAFCCDWATAQLKAGATAICYFDPVSSPTIIPREHYLETGFVIAKRTIASIQGPVATHLASGRCMGISDLLPQTGTAVVGVSMEEDLDVLKSAFAGKATIMGNLNGIAMRNWNAEDAEKAVKKAVSLAARGGGFILSDNHGEIPWQVPEDSLLAIGEAVREWGRYSLGGDHD
ncbi:MAG: uroporphyrinogen decarboxylase family protein [Desulfomicrobium sp.]|nr:uroporphyrinogen decarboxylase family protein [Pseudomonadota bacterium]MBV1710606.1 uroporphyrinogen decarboxylase family protein [Desulfomicrobium sp.]MBU4570214.1 uroporphyrinogen decarboxylase family protein [Pseudomonadota bacterium]MBU4593134.1 uroporphyrinogen decarboxylase family protein [Pseudomonadota bacterium]MBV1720382.1 uroporphyrinogen decarboxylase family protein [Desulfomicrobium sp.]